MSSKRILVTGAAGFLGSHLCEALVAKGHAVLGLDNLSTGRIENLDNLKSDSRFSLLRCDIRGSLRSGFVVDWVLNFASPASPEDYMRLGLETLYTGSIGTLNTLEYAHNVGATYLMASTSECYGDPLEHPQTEEYWGNVNPIGIRSVYDESKRFSEAAVTAYRNYRNLNTKIVRIFNTYGPRLKVSDGRLVSNFMCAALKGEDLCIYGDGNQTRSLCYVSDLIDGIIRMVESDVKGPINLGCDREISVLGLAKTIIDLTESKSVIRFSDALQDDPKQRCPDIGKAKSLLDWTPKVSLLEGLKLCIPYFKEELCRS